MTGHLAHHPLLPQQRWPSPLRPPSLQPRPLVPLLHRTPALFPLTLLLLLLLLPLLLLLLLLPHLL